MISRSACRLLRLGLAARGRHDRTISYERYRNIDEWMLNTDIKKIVINSYGNVVPSQDPIYLFLEEPSVFSPLYWAQNLNKPITTFQARDNFILRKLVFYSINKRRHLELIFKSITKDHLEIRVSAQLNQRSLTIHLPQEGFFIVVLLDLPIHLLDIPKRVEFRLDCLEGFSNSTLHALMALPLRLQRLIDMVRFEELLADCCLIDFSNFIGGGAEGLLIINLRGHSFQFLVIITDRCLDISLPIFLTCFPLFPPLCPSQLGHLIHLSKQLLPSNWPLNLLIQLIQIALLENIGGALWLYGSIGGVL